MNSADNLLEQWNASEAKITTRGTAETVGINGLYISGMSLELAGTDPDDTATATITFVEPGEILVSSTINSLRRAPKVWYQGRISSPEHFFAVLQTHGRLNISSFA